MNRYDTVDSAPLAKGKNELLKHLAGDRLTLKQAIQSKCYECNGYYVDGKADCKMPDCPLYPFMPYNPGKIRAKASYKNADICPGEALERTTSKRKSQKARMCKEAANG